MDQWNASTDSQSVFRLVRARLDSPIWSDHLPWVLLGIRTSPKEDLGTSPAELVYGANLTVPGDFITRPDDLTVAHELARLREKVKNLAPIPTSFHGQSKSFVLTEIKTAKFVFYFCTC